MERRVNERGYRFATKAQNLEQLRGRLASARIPESVVVRVADWFTHPERALATVARRFPSRALIVRSSALGEDHVCGSKAGALVSVRDVASDSTEAIRTAFEQVIASYRRHLDPRSVEGSEVLVQPMVRVSVAGVVTTRDPSSGAPYFVVNYDDRGRTDVVTSGGAGTTCVRVLRDVQSKMGPVVGRFVELARELERRTGFEPLNIELAMDHDGELVLFQVRPLVLNVPDPRAMDSFVRTEMRTIRAFLESRQRPLPGLAGDSTVFAAMSDWNPAELLGSHPRPLGWSLYRYVISRSSWRRSRTLLGYRDLREHELVVNLGGHPYVDVRNSFNSLVPGAIPEGIATKLVNCYLDRLRREPSMHDSVEFDIVASSYSFDFEVHADRWRREGLTESDIRVVRGALRALTDDMVLDRHGHFARMALRVGRLSEHRATLLAEEPGQAESPYIVRRLLDACEEDGLMPFSVFVRGAFVGRSFVRALRGRGVLTESEYEAFWASNRTVTSQFSEDIDLYRTGRLDLRTLLERYGHLRPGTYEVSIPTYAEMPDVYFGTAGRAGSPERSPREPAAPLDLPGATRTAIAERLLRHGLSFDVDQMFAFVRRMTEMRERIKFEFTKNISVSLDLISKFAQSSGLGPEQVSFLQIDDLLELSERNLPHDLGGWLQHRVEERRARYELTSGLRMPEVLFGVDDIAVVRHQARRPEFITRGRILAECTHLDDLESLPSHAMLRGKIVLVERADPGHDWLFVHGIAGLVTQFGGAGSHMAIRCAELEVPAALGCGERLFQQLRRARQILLDAEQQVVRLAS